MKELEIAELINKLNDADDIYYPIKKDSSYDLAVDFNTLYNGDDDKISDKENHQENRLFYDYLNACFCTSKNKYIFNFDKNLSISNIKIFEPFNEEENKINQRWHACISLLALIDSIACDKDFCNKMMKLHKVSKKEDLPSHLRHGTLEGSVITLLNEKQFQIEYKKPIKSKNKIKYPVSEKNSKSDLAHYLFNYIN